MVKKNSLVVGLAAFLSAPALTWAQLSDTAPVSATLQQYQPPQASGAIIYQNDGSQQRPKVIITETVYPTVWATVYSSALPAISQPLPSAPVVTSNPSLPPQGSNPGYNTVIPPVSQPPQTSINENSSNSLITNASGYQTQLASSPSQQQQETSNPAALNSSSSNTVPAAGPNTTQGQNSSTVPTAGPNTTQGQNSSTVPTAGPNTTQGQNSNSSAGVVLWSGKVISNQPVNVFPLANTQSQSQPQPQASNSPVVGGGSLSSSYMTPSIPASSGLPSQPISSGNSPNNNGYSVAALSSTQANTPNAVTAMPASNNGYSTYNNSPGLSMPPQQPGSASQIYATANATPEGVTAPLSSPSPAPQ